MVVKDMEILYLCFSWLSTLVRGSLTPLQGMEDMVVLVLLSITIYSY